MDKKILVYLFVVSAIVTWVCVIVALIIFRHERNKISKALNVNDIGALRCVQAEELLNKIDKYKRPFLIFIILFTIILLLKLFDGGFLLCKGNTSNHFTLNDIVAAIDPIYLFSWLATIGCYIIMKQMHSNSRFIKRKCEELKMAQSRQEEK